QQQRDRQEQQQAKQPERKKAVRLSICLCDGLSKEQGQIRPGATQHLHTAPARNEANWRTEKVRRSLFWVLACTWFMSPAAKLAHTVDTRQRQSTGKTRAPGWYKKRLLKHRCYREPRSG
ncbi:hypothetical protein FQN60_015730, partial [Etheostoma spectabile]